MLILDELLSGLKDVCAGFPDARKSDCTHTMADIGLSAFSMFFMQSESFLAYQSSLADRRKTSNCQTLFGMAKFPTDNHIRAMLDPVPPALLQPVFDQVVAALRDRGAMTTFQRLGGRTLIALDGTEYFWSQALGCPHSQTRKRANGKVESYHTMLAASIVAPGHAMVVPLMPEFIVKPDGAQKQDCERNAAKRWLAAQAVRMKPLRPVYLGDDLFACQPIAEAVLVGGGDFLFSGTFRFSVTPSRPPTSAACSGNRRCPSRQTGRHRGSVKGADARQIQRHEAFRHLVHRPTHHQNLDVRPQVLDQPPVWRRSGLGGPCEVLP